jgi:hypothetical protein
MTVNLLKYLPPYLQQYRELIEIFLAENPEIEYVRSGIDLVLSNQFIASLTEYGCEKWETALNIEPYPEDTLKTRRFRIMSSLLSDIPYTERKLRSFLDKTCGENYYTLNMYYNDYGIQIRIELESMQEQQIVIDSVKQTIPANLVLDVQINFRTHGWLNENKLTHGAMRAYTHKGIRTIMLG